PLSTHYLVSAFFFSFSPSAAVPSTLSFPTRRSSDLLECFDEHDPSLRFDLGDPQRHHPSPGAHRHRRPCRPRQVHFGRPTAAREDRKSTRLNSSHVSISYAVFCLKKKAQAPRLRSPR